MSINRHLDAIAFAIGVGTPDLRIPPATDGMGWPKPDDPCRSC